VRGRRQPSLVSAAGRVNPVVTVVPDRTRRTSARTAICERTSRLPRSCLLPRDSAASGVSPWPADSPLLGKAHSDYEAKKNRVLDSTRSPTAAPPPVPATRPWHLSGRVRAVESPATSRQAPGPPRPGAARTGRLVVTLGNQTVIGQLTESVAATLAFAGVGTRLGADCPARGIPRGRRPVDPARPLRAVGRRHRRQGQGRAWWFRAACVAHRPRPGHGAIGRGDRWP
jgi:hypothetical protein